VAEIRQIEQRILALPIDNRTKPVSAK